jgi:hypothetical protein
MKHLLYICFCLMAFGAQAQDLWLMGKDQSWQNAKGALLVEGLGVYRSNVFDNQMTDKLAFGGTLDPRNLQGMEENLRDINRFGADLNLSVQVLDLQDSLFNNPHWGWSFQVAHRSSIYSSFTADAFRLGFQGNKQFRGAHADLSSSNFNSITYQKFGVGLFKKETLSGIRLSLVNGQRFSRVDVNEADLYTSFSGDSLSLTYKGDYYQSDTTFNSFGNGNGIGAAIDADWNLSLEDGKGYLSISFRDLGFVVWNKNTLHYSADTVFNYTGFQLEDLFDDELGQTAGWQFPALEDTLGYNQEQKTHFQWLPASVDVSLRRRNTDNDFFELGVNVRPQTGYIPQLYGAYSYFTNPKTLVSARFRYGGYGGLRFGASVEKWIGNNWYLALITEDVPGFVLNNMKGRGLYVRFSRLLQHHDRKTP